MYNIIKYASLAIVTMILLITFYARKHTSESKLYSKDKKVIKFYYTCIQLLDKYWLVALLGIFIVFLFTRFYAIDIVPAGVHLDEIGYWYDAKCLTKYGTDRLGHRYPCLPVAYGDGHSPLYTYMCVLVLKFFPFSVKLMRQVMAVSAIPYFFAAFGIVYQLYESRRWALLGPIFVTVTPFFLMSSRWGLNAYQMLTVCTVAIYFMIRGIKYGKTRDFFFSGIFIGFSLVTYIMSFIMMPVFFILLFLYLLYVGKFKWKDAIATFIPCLFIGMSTFLEQLVNLDIIKPFYFLGSDYFKLESYRISELKPINLIKNIGNIITLIFGDNVYTFNSVREFGTVYWASIPLLIAGLVIGFITLAQSLRNRKINLLAPVVIYAVSVYFGFLFDNGCNAYKGNAIYISFVLFIIAGIRYLSGYSLEECTFVSADSDKINESTPVGKVSSVIVFNKTLVISSLAIIALNFLLFTNFYFRHMNEVYGCHPVFISTVAGDMLNYVENKYNVDGDKPVYMELNYENRDYAEWAIALLNNIEPNIFNEYLQKRSDADDKEKYKIALKNYIFAFPENFDETENAIYILGYEWDHISSYLISIGFNCDETIPGYKILYR